MSNVGLRATYLSVGRPPSTARAPPHRRGTATMTDTTKDRHPATRPSHAWAYARWSTGSLLIAGTALAGALAELLNGGPLGTCLALLAVTVVTGRGHIRARD